MALQKDEITIDIMGITMRVSRLSTLPVPSEVTAVIPRVELRIWRYRDGKPVEIEEKVLNSVTIVHAPRHPPSGESPRAASTTWTFSPGRRRREAESPN
ncbi:hypothetical protein Tph_c22820 [Thermacetogenium phaeum DSM 12270]|uniref:Uncharacterized protein n=1 Tax=Thermacetogenium phaeum (strain ATCC BAA-254 / DSM 26808 / PB) TaxID=1089553 RepID=K4LK72_THEPS|nr:hypothetical protein [Thermacetogenium phaeum]AFV12472.1 hypothetical protein Tph_c22820 [Thermacetogenium phaeum DSM 12270]